MAGVKFFDSSVRHRADGVATEVVAYKRAPIEFCRLAARGKTATRAQCSRLRGLDHAALRRHVVGIMRAVNEAADSQRAQHFGISFALAGSSQDVARHLGLDRGRSLGFRKRRRGVFENCLKMRETTPLEPFVRDTKVYAPGIGIVEDGPLKLVSHKYVQRPPR